MQKTYFSIIATALGLLLLALLLKSAPLVAGGEPRLPLLTMLIVSEFGFIVTAIGAFTGIKTVLLAGKNKYIIASTFCCAAMSIKFFVIGFSYWPL